MINLEDYCTLIQAAREKGLSRSAMKYHLDRGEFPGAFQLNMGRTSPHLIPWDELEDWTPNPPGPIPREKKL